MPPRGRRLLRTAAVGGAAYYVGSSRSKTKAAEQQAEAEQAAQQQADAEQAAQQQAESETFSGDDYGQLKQLAELKDQGIITEAEFEIQKSKILGE